MARGLYGRIPLFKASADECFDILNTVDLLNVDLRPQFLGTKEATMEFERPTVLQPLLFVVEYSITQLYLAVGVTPAVVAGHSLGEYTAAVIGGMLSLKDGLALVAARSKAIESVSADGAMLSVVDWTQDELDSVANGERPGVWLAALNSPAHSVLSGEVFAIAAIEEELKKAQRKCTRLRIAKAFHSALILDAAETLKDVTVGIGSASVPTASNYTGDWLHPAQLQDGTYWMKHMRNTVLWRRCFEKVLTKKPAAVLEVGPGNSLNSLSSRCDEGRTTKFVQSMRHPRTVADDVQVFVSSLARLWETGFEIDWVALSAMLGQHPGGSVRLPTYSFERTSVWTHPERSIYVEGSTSRVEQHGLGLVRFAERRTPASLKAYCLPFAGGSSGLFSQWIDTDTDMEVVALELPGRGARANERRPQESGDDTVMLDAFCQAILADLQTSKYVLLGCSMGANLCVELALRMAELEVPLPLAVYIAGRKAPAADSDHRYELSDEDLARYSIVSPEVARSKEFTEHVLPLLRSDLELDARSERRLTSVSRCGRHIPANVGLTVISGISDEVAPWTDAHRWQVMAQTPVTLQYLPGGHEFMLEHGRQLHALCRRDAMGHLLRVTTASLANMANQAVAFPSAVSAPNCPKPLPFNAVRWVESSGMSVCSCLTTHPSTYPEAVLVELDEVDRVLAGRLAEVAKALKQGAPLIVTGSLMADALAEEWLDSEIARCWKFVHLVQELLEMGARGRIVVVCQAVHGAMMAGASKSVAMEVVEFRVQRVYVPPGWFGAGLAGRVRTLADGNPAETDLWVKHGSLYVPRIEPMSEPVSRLPCVPKISDGQPALYLLTGATGGLGRSVVQWLLSDQKLNSNQLVLLRRTGSTPLPAALKGCRLVELSEPHNFQALDSALRNLVCVTGIFHMAGVLEDGILANMTEEKIRKVALAKSGIAVSLLRVARERRWPLKWCLNFSSTSSLFGYAGQANYCAANAVLDHLAQFGSPEHDWSKATRVITVNWGPWAEAGMARIGTKAHEQALKEGDKPLDTSTALRCLGASLRAGGQAQAMAVQFAVCDVDWDKSPWGDLPLLSLIKEPSVTPKVVESGKSRERTSLEEFLVLQTTGTSWEKIRNKTFNQLGVDSLEVVQLRNAFNRKFGANVSIAMISDPTLKVHELLSKMQAFVNSCE